VLISLTVLIVGLVVMIFNVRIGLFYYKLNVPIAPLNSRQYAFVFGLVFTFFGLTSLIDQLSR